MSRSAIDEMRLPWSPSREIRIKKPDKKTNMKRKNDGVE